MSKKVKRTAEAKRSQKMTDPPPTRDQLMMEMSEKAPAGMMGVLAATQHERDPTQGELNKLNNLNKDKIQDETEHNKRKAGREMSPVACVMSLQCVTTVTASSATSLETPMNSCQIQFAMN